MLASKRPYSFTVESSTAFLSPVVQIWHFFIEIVVEGWNHCSDNTIRLVFPDFIAIGSGIICISGNHHKVHISIQNCIYFSDFVVLKKSYQFSILIRQTPPWQLCVMTFFEWSAIWNWISVQWLWRLTVSIIRSYVMSDLPLCCLCTHLGTQFLEL